MLVNSRKDNPLQLGVCVCVGWGWGLEKRKLRPPACRGNWELKGRGPCRILHLKKKGGDSS